MPSIAPDPRLRKRTLGVGASLLALYVAQNWGGERFGLTALLLYLPQHGWALPPLLLLCWSLKRRQLRLAFLNLLSLLFWSHFLLGFRFFPWFKNQDAVPDQFRLMSYNIERGAGGIPALERAIRAQNPDIVCLQESQGRNRDAAYAPGAEIAAHFLGWHAAHGGDVMTLSRFPLHSKRDYPLRGTRRILETTWETPRGPVRVLNVHVSTSVRGQSQTARGKIGRILGVIKNARPSAQARMEQIAPLQRAIGARDAKIPLLVAGDFNSPPRGRFYRAISRDLVDAWKVRGRGTGNTFPSRFPLLPIDHVLTRGVSVEAARVPRVRASDHRPVVVDFRL